MSYSMFTLGEIEASAEFSVGGAVDKAIGAVGRGAKKTGQVVWATSKRGVRYARRVGARVGGAVMSGAKTAAKHVRAHGGKYAIGAGALAAGAGVAGYLASRKKEQQYSRHRNVAQFAEFDPDFYKKAGAAPAVGYRGAGAKTGSQVDKAMGAVKKAGQEVKKAGQMVWATSKRGVRYARRVGQRVGGAVMSGAKTAARHVRAHKGKYAIGAAALAVGAGAVGLANRRRKEEYSAPNNPYLVEFNSKKKSLKRRAIAR